MITMRAWDLEYGDLVQVEDVWLRVKIVGSHVDSQGERFVLCDGGAFSAGPDHQVNVRRTTSHVTTLPEIREALDLRESVSDLVPHNQYCGRVLCAKERALIRDVERTERLKGRHAGHAFQVEHVRAVEALENLRQERLVPQQSAPRLEVLR